MAFLESTEILKAVVKAEGAFSESEFREGTNTTARTLFLNEPLVFKNSSQLKKSVSQPTEAIMQMRKSDALANNKLANHSGGLGDSFVSPISYVAKSRTFAVSYKLTENNQFGYEEQLQAGMLNAMMDLRQEINAFGLAQLAANKTQVAADNALLTWEGADFKYTNASGLIDRAAGRIKSTIKKNKYSSNMVDIIAGSQMANDLNHNFNQGGSNDENLQYQFNNITMVEEENLDESVLGVNGFGYVMPKGTVGMTSWNEGINRSGRGDVNANEGLFTTISDPIISGLMYDVHIKRGLADNALTSKTMFQDPTDQYEVTAYFAFGSAYTSVANESPIFAVEQL